MDLNKSIKQFYFDMTISELRQMNESRAEDVLSYNSVMYLDLIAYKEKCTVSFLAEALHISKSAVTMKVNELMKWGLVTKAQSQKDKRIHYLEVSERVIEEYQAYDRELKNALEKIEVRFSKKERDDFCEILKALGEEMSAEENETRNDKRK